MTTDLVNPALLVRPLGEYILQLAIQLKQTRIHVTTIVPPDKRKLRHASCYSQFEIGRLVGDMFQGQLEYDAPSGWFTIPECGQMDYIKKKCKQIIVLGIVDNEPNSKIQPLVVQMLMEYGMEMPLAISTAIELYDEVKVLEERLVRI